MIAPFNLKGEILWKTVGASSGGGGQRAQSPILN